MNMMNVKNIKTNHYNEQLTFVKVLLTKDIRSLNHGLDNGILTDEVILLKLSLAQTSAEKSGRK